MRTCAAASLALLGACALALAQDPGVRVDASVNVVLGEQREISAAMFGITAFEGFPAVVADADYRARVAALRPGVFRFGGNLSWCAPAEYDPAWYATPEAVGLFERCLLYGDRYAFARFLPEVRRMGAEPIFSFASPPPYLTEAGTTHPSDFDRWAQLCVGYLSLWKRADPALRLVQIWNEPNASWYLDPRAKPGGPTPTALHIDMANRVSRAVKQRFPEVQVGGPVLCWPPAWPPEQQGQRPWYTWEDWTLPWLEGTRETIDFFDFHVYGVSPEDFAVQTEMVANAAQRIQGRDLPIWITESNYELPAAELADPVSLWRKRVLPYERLLLRGMLPQADKLAGNLLHDLHAASFQLLPSADEPNPMYWLLWVLRDLRGTRVVADSGDPDVLAFATHADDATTLVLFNDSSEPKRLPLSMTVGAGWWTGPEVRAIGEGPGGGGERISVECSLEHAATGPVGEVVLPPLATVSITVRSQSWVEPAAQRRQVEWFGDRNLSFIRAGETVSTHVAVPTLPQPGDRLSLRLGLLGPTGAEPLRVKWNGEKVPAPATALQELPLRQDQVAADNLLEIGLASPSDNPRLALGFASVVVVSGP